MTLDGYWLIAAGWLTLAVLSLWVTERRHVRTRRALSRILNPLILPALGIAERIRHARRRAQ